MGLTGFAIALYRLYHLQVITSLPFKAVFFLSLLLYVLFLVLWGLKWVYNYNEAKADVSHPVRSNLLSTISISTLLISIAMYAVFPMAAAVLWWSGMLLQAFLSIRSIAFWINRNFEIHHFSPLWFIPAVGNIIIPVIGVDIVDPAISWFFFVSGLFFWIILMTINMNRIIFHHQMPQKFVPSFFIMIAPPAVGFIAYMRIAQSWDLFSTGLLFLAVFTAILLLTMIRNFTKLKFFLSWWAFTFPIDALSITMAVAYQVTHNSFYLVMAQILMWIALLIILTVGWYTIRDARRGEICVKED